MRPIYKHGDKAYVVLRRVSIPKFKVDEHPENMEMVKEYRDWIGADHVLRDQTHFIFCETVQDVEWEEVKIEENDRETSTVVGV
jgi:hypothetical protein